MFNNHLVNEEATEKIKQRAQEAEAYRMHKQLGYDESKTARWIFVLIVLVVAAVLILLF
jgi:hypothetical protein